MVAGGCAAGSQAPGSLVFEVSRTAATTRPTLVVTFSETTRDPFSSSASDWTTRPCGGTSIPASVLPMIGPLSVSTLTVASAACASVFIR